MRYLPALGFFLMACSGSVETSPTKDTTTSPPVAAAPVGVPCEANVATSLPGISARVKNARCDFTLAEAAAGIQLEYELVVDADLPKLYVDAYEGTPTTELDLFGSLSGGTQGYCLCDIGPRPSSVHELHVAAGSYAGLFEWDGRNWGGPSDTEVEEGPAFPAGSYVLKLHSEGAFAKPDASGKLAKDFTLEVTIPIILVE